MFGTYLHRYFLFLSQCFPDLLLPNLPLPSKVPFENSWRYLGRCTLTKIGYKPKPKPTILPSTYTRTTPPYSTIQPWSFPLPPFIFRLREKVDQPRRRQLPKAMRWLRQPRPRVAWLGLITRSTIELGVTTLVGTKGWEVTAGPCGSYIMCVLEWGDDTFGLMGSVKRQIIELLIQQASKVSFLSQIVDIEGWIRVCIYIYIRYELKFGF